jgi:hypothetical protein
VLPEVRRRRTRYSVGIALAWLMLLAGSSARAAEGKSEALAGEWTGDALRVRWRDVNRTRYGPDTLIEIENKLDRPVTARFDWTARVCDGRETRASSDFNSFVHGLHWRQFGIDPRLPPGGWDALLFPRASEPEKDSDPTTGCVVRIEIGLVGSAAGADRFELVLPVPPPQLRRRD